MMTSSARGDVNHIVRICEENGMKKCGDKREGTTSRTISLAFAITYEGKAFPFLTKRSMAPWYAEDGDDPKKIARLRFEYEKDPSDEMGQRYEDAVKKVERALGYDGVTYLMKERFPGQ